MNCPRCEQKTRVLDSRAAGSHGWRRRRSCPACGYRYSTKEISGEVVGNLLRENKALKEQKKIYEAALGLAQASITRQVGEEVDDGGLETSSLG